MRGLHRRPSAALAGLNIEESLGDIADKKYMLESLQGVDAVIHCAAKISIDGDKSGEVARTNVDGTQCVIDSCEQLNIPRLVHISSIHAFDLTTKKPVEGASPLVGDKGFAYDQSKRDGLLKVRAAKDKLNSVILCPVGLLGPEDYQLSLMGAFFLNLYHGKLPSLVKGAFYWADTRDTAIAAINALSIASIASGSVYLLGGHYATVGELARTAESSCQEIFNNKKRMRLPELPYAMALLGLPFLRSFAYLTGGPPLYTYESLQVLRHHPPSIDDSPARKDLEYRLRPLKDTVTDVYTWLKEKGKL